MIQKQVAKLNYLRIAPRKVRAVGDLIKGLSVNEAEAQLLMERRRPSVFLLKLLRSAVAGAKEKKLELDALYIESLRVDQGPMLKRSLPRARGMATPIQKKTSHVTLVLAPHPSPKKPRFTVVIREKKKRSTDEKRSKADRADKEEFAPRAKARKPGFFRKVFSRKSGGE